MITRLIYKQLLAWKKLSQPKPLIMRGARQIGKTFLIREIGKTFANFVELNFEKDTLIKEIFAKDLSVARIIRDLKLYTGKEIIIGKTLIFFDEIQEAPEAIKALRYFYEELPGLHIIAAGSLLDFALENIGVPVGRVDFLYLYPVSFLEFLIASNNAGLAHEILQHQPSTPLNPAIHQKLLDLLAIYLAIGGMPEVIQCWLDTQDLVLCNNICHTLIAGYRQDFQKYAKKFQIKYIDLLFNSVPLHQGKQFKYSNISQEYRKRELMPCLELLAKAHIVHIVAHSSGNGVPLGAEVKSEKFKVIFLDVALSQAALGLNVKDWLLNSKQTFINHGPLVEAFVGQELLAYSNPNIKTNLHYWLREIRGSEAEVDYLIAKERKIIPIEVKSSEKGAFKSMKMFLQSKSDSPYGIKFSTQNYSQLPLDLQLQSPQLQSQSHSRQSSSQLSSLRLEKVEHQSSSLIQSKVIYSYPLYAIAKILNITI